MDIYIPSLQNKGLLDSYLKYNTFRGCELAPANTILWSEHYCTGFVIIENMLSFCRLKNGKPVSFSFPIGAGDKKKAFDAIAGCFEQNKMDFSMYMVEPDMFARIEEWYPGMYEVQYNRDSADYLYETETLASLSGKKLHGKRNHINRFLENYPDYKYERIDDENCDECLELAYAWAKKNIQDEPAERVEDKTYEKCALEFALKHRDELGLIGALIRVEGRVVAFTLGGRLTEDTFDINFEKAYAEVQGAYAMINREFVRRELTGYKYVNREEDMGVPGLRHAKTSYQPVCLVEKGLVSRAGVS